MKKSVVSCWLLAVSVALATGARADAVSGSESDSFAVKNVTSRDQRGLV